MQKQHIIPNRKLDLIQYSLAIINTYKLQKEQSS